MMADSQDLEIKHQLQYHIYVKSNYKETGLGQNFLTFNQEKYMNDQEINDSINS